MAIKLAVGDTSFTHLKPRITVIGVGGGGGNAISNMMSKNLEGVDFVVANILHFVLAEIMGDLKNIMKPQAKMVLSGILDEKKPVVLDAIQKHGLKISETLHQDQWVAFVVEN